MGTDRVIYLYQRIHDNAATPDELYELSVLLQDPESESALKLHWAQYWDLISDADLNTVVINRYEEIYAEIVARPQHKLQVKKIKLWPRIAVAAAAVATIVFGVWFFNTSRYPDTSLSSRVSRDLNDIAPGKNTAMLSINNGKAITLSEAKSGVIIGAAQIKYNDGTALSTAATKSLTITTPRGGTYQVRLPDGTNVWVNAASSLTYATALKERGAERVVKLSGEAYFEVAKDKAHPFIVQTAGQSLKVLGTHFNVNAYTDEGRTVTTLIEGSVRVASNATALMTKWREVILKPNQQSTLANNTLSVGLADPNATAWVKGKFRFDNTSLEDVMKQLARWYDVEIVYPEGVPDKRFTGGINRNNNLTAVLKMMKIMNVNFRIEGKKIIVSK